MNRLVPVLCLVAAACGPGGEDGPPAIRYGESACSECRMIVLEERFAASGRTSAGEPLAFDDVGCLARFAAHAAPGERYWVHDHRGEVWTLASEAVFVRSPDLATPMGSGIVAFSSPEAARAFAHETGGRTLRFGDLATAIQIPLPHSQERREP